ncbi:unnamed protein product, partial [Notodromas monacha]
MADDENAAPEGEIDESLYSRQIFVLGKEAMMRMAVANVCISGMGGLGVEIAKNVCLAGVKTVTLHDEKPVTWYDLNSQFYVKENQVGKNRAESCLGLVSELNTYVPTTASTAPIDEAFVKKFRVMCLSDNSFEEQVRVGKMCRDNKIIFIVAETKGAFGKVFFDGGEDFECVDQNGEAPLIAPVINISKAEDGMVTCPDDNRHGFETGDHVAFTEIKGMTELNDRDPIPIKVTGPFTFTIGNTMGFSEYEGPGGTVSQLHLAFQSIHKFEADKGQLPRPYNRADAEEFLGMVNDLNDAQSGGAKGEIDPGLIKTFAYTSRGCLAPICSLLGSFVGQEVMKACSGKFNPLNQFLYFDATECLPDDVETISEDSAAA